MWQEELGTFSFVLCWAFVLCWDFTHVYAVLPPFISFSPVCVQLREQGPYLLRFLLLACGKRSISSMDNCLDCSQVYSHPLTMSYATPLANCDSCPVSLQVNLMLSECDPWHL